MRINNYGQSIQYEHTKLLQFLSVKLIENFIEYFVIHFLILTLEID